LGAYVAIAVDFVPTNTYLPLLAKVFSVFDGVLLRVRLKVTFGFLFSRKLFRQFPQSSVTYHNQ
jgi:hypothetical protein